MQYILIKKDKALYVAESHYFDVKGVRQITLTDKEEYAERMTLAEANKFLEGNTGYTILEASNGDEDEVEVNE